MRLSPKQRWAGLMAILFSGIVLMILYFDGSRIDSIILFPENTSLSAKRSLVREDLIPLSWTWYWRTKEFVFGKRKTVSIYADFIHIERANENGQVVLPAALKTIKSLHFYLVKTNEVSERCSYIAMGETRTSQWLAAVTTSDGTRAKVMMGAPQGASSSLELVARRRSGHTDLLTFVEVTGLGGPGPIAMRHLKFAARFQIPKDHAVLILKSDPGDPVLVGLVLTPHWK